MGTTIRELREAVREDKFKDRYKPSRKQVFAFNEVLDRMVATTKSSKEAVYHLMYDAFCFTHQVVLPKTYAGFRHVLKSYDLL